MCSTPKACVRRRRKSQVKIVATTLREVHSTNRHSWGAVAWIDGETYVSPTAELDVIDRVGGGDGFASGFFYGLLTGESPEEALKLERRLRAHPAVSPCLNVANEIAAGEGE
jgi:sugar/nucleoside kinase (ribokinase family)